MIQKSINRIGWVISIALGLLFAMSAFLKLTHNETALQQAASMGFDPSTYFLIGLIEVTALVLFLIPRTALLGSLLLIAYMGGAIASHLQHQQSITIAIVVQVLLWLTVAFRFPDLFQGIIPIMKQKHSVD